MELQLCDSFYLLFFQKTIIMWSESDGKTYALSFLNEKDREELWTRIEEVNIFLIFFFKFYK